MEPLLCDPLEVALWRKCSTGERCPWLLLDLLLLLVVVVLIVVPGVEELQETIEMADNVETKEAV